MGFDKKFEHSQELFDAALEEFINKGYEQASINTILETAGMSKGQFYYHFKNKEDLYISLIGVLISKKKEFVDRVMKPGDFEQDIYSIFKSQMKFGLAFAKEYPAINRFSESFLREKGNSIYQKVLTIYNFQNNEQIASLVENAIRKGEIRSDLPPRFVKNIVGYLFTNIADLAGLCTPDEFEDGMNYLIDFIKHGLEIKPVETGKDLAGNVLAESVKGYGQE